MKKCILALSLLLSLGSLASAKIKMLAVEINPILKSQDNRKANTFLKWADPETYVSEMMQDFRQSSHSFYDLEISEWLHWDEFPRYSAEITRKDGTFDFSSVA